MCSAEPQRGGIRAAETVNKALLELRSYHEIQLQEAAKLGQLLIVRAAVVTGALHAHGPGAVSGAVRGRLRGLVVHSQGYTCVA